MAKTWTAEEFETLSVAEQDKIYRASIVWDLDKVPEDLVSRMRARIEQRIAAEELRNAS